MKNFKQVSLFFIIQAGVTIADDMLPSYSGAAPRTRMLEFSIQVRNSTTTADWFNLQLKQNQPYFDNFSTASKWFTWKCRTMRTWRRWRVSWARKPVARPVSRNWRALCPRVTPSITSATGVASQSSTCQKRTFSTWQRQVCSLTQFLFPCTCNIITYNQSCIKFNSSCYTALLITKDSFITLLYLYLLFS